MYMNYIYEHKKIFCSSYYWSQEYSLIFIEFTLMAGLKELQKEARIEGKDVTVYICFVLA